MSDSQISYANLDYIENSLSALNSGVSHLTDQVSSVNLDLYEVRTNLEQLIQEFQEYVKKDLLGKNLQLAETRIVKVRQEIESDFGHYGEVRRRVTGILQAVDVGLVKKETVANASEEHMLSSPRYWLAPCLISLSAWLSNNKELADKSMMEALRRDSEKTALFFTLVTRRGGRYQASSEWLNHYLGLQNPEELEREIVVMIDGFTNGIFGPDARSKCGQQIESWITELSQKVGFVEEQNAQWKVALESKIEEQDIDMYPYLADYSPTWEKLKSSLEGAKLHENIHDYFEDIFSQEVSPSKTIAFAVDAMLDTLITKFDEEELPLRKEERLLSLIIEQSGNEGHAQTLFNNEKSLEERVSFTQLLTNFAMQPEISNASLTTQKFSIAWSKEWIKNAHDDITADNRASVPSEIAIEIKQWNGVTETGENEEELVKSLERHVDREKKLLFSEVKFKGAHYIGMIATIMFIYMGFSTPILLFLAIFSAGYVYLGYKEMQKRKAKISQIAKEQFENDKILLRATLAEVVDWRQEYAKEDANASKVSDLLEAVNPEQYSFSRYGNARAILS
ncbi:hypothetical protein [Planococcus halocryophilus]|uniref:hypothetical protein n=1 Tax=Planococcus halocryophilus TaxID=1215089 RepID=UPI001F100C58|nr:hypothetical protein [Planococcus halocryophilus]MCH4826772.1 hypothetical protein [Planococcus halocryophilus]